MLDRRSISPNDERLDPGEDIVEEVDRGNLAHESERASLAFSVQVHIINAAARECMRMRPYFQLSEEEWCEIISLVYAKDADVYHGVIAEMFDEECVDKVDGHPRLLRLDLLRSESGH